LDPTQKKPLSEVEKIKAESRLLRGNLAQSMADPVTGGIPASDNQLMKFHGSYLQDDRDLREERRLQKLEPAYSFMLRTRLPGGICTPAQWLALDALARTYANGTLRVTTRQAFQLHGVLKGDFKKTIAGMHQVLIDTIAACGDVNRNVMCNPNPVESAAHRQVYEWAVRLSEHLLPSTRAYYELWLDGEKVEGGEQEPLYGPTYLPRKFKTAIAIPPHNDVDVFAHDLGFIAILQGGRLLGFNVTVGGGMGATHGDAATFPRLADVIGFVPPERLLQVAEGVLTLQRDHGDRTNRKHARLKYTLEDRGLPWFVAELEKRTGFPLEAARPFAFEHNGDRMGWQEGHDGRWHLTLPLPSGRLADGPGGDLLTGLREIARVHQGDLRLTPNQNVIVAGVPAAERDRIHALAAAHGLSVALRASPVRQQALACVALPTCSLAMAEAERYLPHLLDRVDALLQRHGLLETPISLRVTGCPNGCARPYLAEVALVGKAPGRYNLYLGGDARGQRLNKLHRENIDEQTLLTLLDQAFGAFARDRLPGESFGDFCVRTLHTPSPRITPERGSLMHGRVYEDVTQLIGRTPIVKLARSTGPEEATILAKVEFFNPGGSVKDRIGLAMIEDAERRGALRPGMTIVEPTSGNTGVALAMVATVKGYKLVLTMPESMSVERRRILEAYGAELVLTPAAKGMNGAVEAANELLTSLGDKGFMPQQFNNPANVEVHRQTTAREILGDLDIQSLDAFVAGIGTGGTISGAGAILKKEKPSLRVVAVEPLRSPLLTQGTAGPHRIQGIGANFVPQILDRTIYDEVIDVGDVEAYRAARELARKEGLLVGISSGAALHAARQVARKLGPGKTVLTVLPDTGERYWSSFATFEEELARVPQI
jgi:sulfite reductase (NADPH) hemoprotein beta-component